MNERAQLSFAELPVSLEVRRFSVREAIQRPFEATVTAVSADADLSLDTLVGTDVQLLLEAVTTTRALGGICRSVELVETEIDSLFAYEVTIVAPLWLLGQRTNHRIFQHASIPDIADQLLAPLQTKPVWRIDRARYPRFEQRAQYGESDLTFLHRLLEEAGISFFFEDDIEEGTVLVLHDDPVSASPRSPAPVPWTAAPSLVSEAERVTDVRFSGRVRPGLLTLRDYDPDRGAPCEAAAKIGAPPETSYEQFWFEPGALLVERTGAQSDPAGIPWRTTRAARALAAARSDTRSVSFETNALGLSPGAVFSFGGHPHPELSEAQRLLVTELSIDGGAGEGWHARGVAVLADRPYHPPRSTPKPRIEGVHTARVTASAEAAEIHTDPLGRVHVELPWDRDPSRGDTSCWVRVSQAWAGSGYGLFTVPRVGHEVLLAFVDGDPDQPVIVGSLHNGVAPPPYTLPDNKTVSVWKTRSSPGGEGENELRLDDRKNEEHFFVRAERDLAHEVAGNAARVSGRNRARVVSGSTLDHVVQHRTELVRGRAVDVVGKYAGERVNGDRHAVVGGRDTLRVGTWAAVQVVPGLDDLLRRDDDEVESAALSTGQFAAEIAALTASASLYLSGDRIVLSTASGMLLLEGPNITLVGDLIETGSLTKPDDVPAAVGNIPATTGGVSATTGDVSATAGDVSATAAQPDLARVILTDPSGNPVWGLVVDRNHLPGDLPPDVAMFLRGAEPIELRQGVMYGTGQMTSDAVAAALRPAVVGEQSLVSQEPAPGSPASDLGEDAPADKPDLARVLYCDADGKPNWWLIVDRSRLPAGLPADVAAYVKTDPVELRKGVRYGASQMSAEDVAAALHTALIQEGPAVTHEKKDGPGDVEIRQTFEASILAATVDENGQPTSGHTTRAYTFDGNFSGRTMHLLDVDSEFRGDGADAPWKSQVFVLGDLTTEEAALHIDSGNKRDDGPLGSLVTRDPLLESRFGDYAPFGREDANAGNGLALLPDGAKPTGPFWINGNDEGKKEGGRLKRLIRYDATGKRLGEITYERMLSISGPNGHTIKIGNPIHREGVFGFLAHTVLPLASIGATLFGMPTYALWLGLANSALRSKNPLDFVWNVGTSVAFKVLAPNLGPYGLATAQSVKSVIDSGGKLSPSLVAGIASNYLGASGMPRTSAIIGAAPAAAAFISDPGNLQKGIDLLGGLAGINQAYHKGPPGQRAGGNQASSSEVGLAFTSPEGSDTFLTTAKASPEQTGVNPFQSGPLDQVVYKVAPGGSGGGDPFTVAFTVPTGDKLTQNPLLGSAADAQKYKILNDAFHQGGVFDFGSDKLHLFGEQSATPSADPGGSVGSGASPSGEASGSVLLNMVVTLRNDGFADQGAPGGALPRSSVGLDNAVQIEPDGGVLVAMIGSDDFKLPGGLPPRAILDVLKGTDPTSIRVGSHLINGGKERVYSIYEHRPDGNIELTTYQIVNGQAKPYYRANITISNGHTTGVEVTYTSGSSAYIEDLDIPGRKNGYFTAGDTIKYLDGDQAGIRRVRLAGGTGEKFYNTYSGGLVQVEDPAKNPGVPAWVVVPVGSNVETVTFADGTKHYEVTQPNSNIISIVNGPNRSLQVIRGDLLAEHGLPEGTKVLKVVNAPGRIIHLVDPKTNASIADATVREGDKVIYSPRLIEVISPDETRTLYLSNGSLLMTIRPDGTITGLMEAMQYYEIERVMYLATANLKTGDIDLKKVEEAYQAVVANNIVGAIPLIGGVRTLLYLMNKYQTRTDIGGWEKTFDAAILVLSVFGLSTEVKNLNSAANNLDRILAVGGEQGSRLVAFITDLFKTNPQAAKTLANEAVTAANLGDKAKLARLAGEIPEVTPSGTTTPPKTPKEVPTKPIEVTPVTPTSMVEATPVRVMNSPQELTEADIPAAYIDRYRQSKAAAVHAGVETSVYDFLVGEGIIRPDPFTIGKTPTNTDSRSVGDILEAYGKQNSPYAGEYSVIPLESNPALRLSLADIDESSLKKVLETARNYPGHSPSLLLSKPLSMGEGLWLTVQLSGREVMQYSFGGKFYLVVGTESEVGTLANIPLGSILGWHTHPKNLPPSANDARALADYMNNKSVVIAVNIKTVGGEPAVSDVTLYSFKQATTEGTTSLLNGTMHISGDGGVPVGGSGPVEGSVPGGGSPGAVQNSLSTLNGGGTISPAQAVTLQNYLARTGQSPVEGLWITGSGAKIVPQAEMGALASQAVATLNQGGTIPKTNGQTLQLMGLVDGAQLVGVGPGRAEVALIDALDAGMIKTLETSKIEQLLSSPDTPPNVKELLGAEKQSRTPSSNPTNVPVTSNNTPVRLEDGLGPFGTRLPDPVTAATLEGLKRIAKGFGLDTPIYRGDEGNLVSKVGDKSYLQFNPRPTGYVLEPDGTRRTITEAILGDGQNGALYFTLSREAAAGYARTRTGGVVYQTTLRELLNNGGVLRRDPGGTTGMNYAVTGNGRVKVEVLPAQEGKP